MTVTLAVLLSGCASLTNGSPSAITTTPTTPTTPTDTPLAAAPRTSATRSHPPTPPANATSSASSPGGDASGSGPVIVIDPGHSVTIHATDPVTGLNTSDYENEPEMRDVYSVAELVRATLVAAGYRVIMTKPTLTTPTSLGQRSAIANAAHAALALSIHDQAGSNGGIGFDAGNNIVYYQSVGDYRETSNGTKVYFTDAAIAAVSRRYGQIFQARRAAAQRTSVSLMGDTGYDLGSRGLPAGDIWIVQLLAHVPWIYNEAGGNSAGQVGLNAADQRTYADGLVAAVEACVPVHH